MDTEKALLDYAAKYLHVRNFAVTSVTLEQAVDFARQLRRGCLQDLRQLLANLIGEARERRDDMVELALISLSEAIAEAKDSWGLPDCDCGKSECVYCSGGYAIAPEKS